jgi:hypothetical protein
MIIRTVEVIHIRIILLLLDRVSLEVSILLACGGTLLGDRHLMFQDNMLVSSSRVKMSIWRPVCQHSMVVSSSTVEMSTVLTF